MDLLLEKRMEKFSKNNILLLQELVVSTMLPKKVLSQLFLESWYVHATGSGKNQNYHLVSLQHQQRLQQR